MSMLKKLFQWLKINKYKPGNYYRLFILVLYKLRISFKVT